MIKRNIKDAIDALQKSNNGEHLEILKSLLTEGSFYSRLRYKIFFHAIPAMALEFILFIIIALLSAYFLKVYNLQNTAIREILFILILVVHTISVLFILAVTPRDKRSVNQRFQKASAHFEEFCTARGLSPCETINAVISYFSNLQNTAAVALTLASAGLLNGLASNDAFSKLTSFDPSFFQTTLLGGVSLLFLFVFIPYWYLRIFCPLNWARYMQMHLCK
jgi:hypothetical protein